MARCRIGAWAVVAVATVRVAGSAGVDGCETSFWQIGAEGQTCEAACRLVQPPGTAICKDEALEAWAPLTSGETVAATFKLSDETCGKVYERDSAAASGPSRLPHCSMSGYAPARARQALNTPRRWC